MRATEEQWQYEVERGPDWLFVKLVPPTADESTTPNIGSKIWKLLQHHSAHRVVIEMDKVPAMPTQFLGELITLQQQVKEQQGVLRLSGLNPPCQEEMTKQHLDEQLPSFPTREEAVFAKKAAAVK